MSVTAYRSVDGEVKASSTPTIRRLTPSCRHELSRIAHPRQDFTLDIKHNKLKNRRMYRKWNKIGLSNAGCMRKRTKERR